MSVSFTKDPLAAATPSLRQAAATRWIQLRRRILPHILLGLPFGFALLALGAAIYAIAGERDNAKIYDLRQNHDVIVSTGAPPEVLLARIDFLLAHERVDEVQPYVEALDKKGSDPVRAIAHFNFANGRLRQAFDLLAAGKLDDAGPLVILSRQEYRRALTFAPDEWDAKFNLDVASRLIRDFPAFERTMGDQVKTDRKKIWTDVPGKPEGLP